MTAPTKARSKVKSAREPRAELEMDWQKALDTALTVPGVIGSQYNRFYNYSYLNNILLMMQGATEPVASYEKWRELGRQVKKGAKALMINRPITVKSRTETDPNTGEPKKIQLFKLVRSPFVLSDTEGPDLPPMPDVIDDWSLGRLRSQLDIRLVEFESSEGNMMGWSQKRQDEYVYAINPLNPSPLKTTLHELGHILCDHFEDRPAHQGVGEFQAEAVALLTGTELGVLTDAEKSSARAYCQGWLGTTKPSEVEIRKVFTATNKILTTGRPQQEDKEPTS